MSAPELHLKTRPTTEQADRFANLQLRQTAHATRVAEGVSHHTLVTWSHAARHDFTHQVSPMSGSMRRILIQSLVILIMTAMASRIES